MKKNYFILNVLIIIGISLLSTGIALGQVTITSTPSDTVATVGVQYTYDVNATGTPAPTYSLDVKPSADMSINVTTGLITWTPVNIYRGGKVVVRATNGGGTATQTFYIYVEGPIDCDADFSNTISYWKLDETGQTTYVDSWGSHNASAFNPGTPPHDSAGIVGMSKKNPFSSTMGITVPDHADFRWASDESFSVAFWFKNSRLTYGNVGVMIGKYAGGSSQWWVGIDNSSQDITFWVQTGSGSHVNGWLGSTNDFDWHHYVCLYDAVNDKMRIYRDKVLDPGAGSNQTYTGTNDGFSVSANLTIGLLNDGGTNYPMDGRIDEVLIFNSVLNQSQVNALYDRGLAGQSACLPGNSPPVFRTDAITSAHEDHPYTYQFLANDINSGDALTYNYVKKPDWLTFNGGTRTLSGTPVNDDVGSDSVVIKVNDGDVDVYQRFLLNIINTNDAPVITSTEITTVNEEQPYSYDVNASDVDVGDHQVFSLRPPTPGWLSVNASTGLITGTPPVDNTADFTVTVRVTDDSAAYDEQTYILDILPVNDAPIITGQLPLDVDEDNSLLIQISDITYTDVDNGAGDMTFTVVDGTNYSVVANTITPDLNFSGALVVDIELSDLDSTTSGQIDVTVNPINDAPVILSFPDDEAWVDQLYSYLFEAEDAETDENSLIYSIPDKPDWLIWVPASRALAGTPDFSDIGTDTLTIMVSDGSESADTTIIISVMSANNIPYITSVPVTEVNEDEPYLYNITFEDDDVGDVVTLTCDVYPSSWLTFIPAQNLLTGTPTNDEVGTEPSVDYTVKLRVYDGKEDSTQTFKITVINVPDAPEILEQTVQVVADIGIAKTILLSYINVVDVDNLPEDLTLTVLPGTGYSIAGNDITINPTQDVIVPVNIRVTDPDDLYDEGILNVTVRDNTGIKDIAESNKLVEKVYPIPAGEYIRFIVNSAYDYNLEIIDITGKTVFQEHYAGSDKLVEIKTSDMGSGLYIFKVSSKSAYQVGRFTISNK